MNLGPGKEFDRIRTIMARLAELLPGNAPLGDDCALIPFGATTLALSIDAPTAAEPSDAVWRAAAVHARTLEGADHRPWTALPGLRLGRDPDMRAPRSKSMMSSAVPISQCGFAAKSKVGCSPSSRMTGFSDSSLPMGTPAAGMFGIQ